MINRESILEVISDLSKDACGFRVRHDYDAMSDRELQDRYDYYAAEIESSIQIDRDLEQQAVTRFDARINLMIADHNISRETAIRWDMDAEGTLDMGEYLYNNDLPYNYKV